MGKGYNMNWITNCRISYIFIILATIGWLIGGILSFGKLNKNINLILTYRQDGYIR